MLLVAIEVLYKLPHSGDGIVPRVVAAGGLLLRHCIVQLRKGSGLQRVPSAQLRLRCVRGEVKYTRWVEVLSGRNLLGWAA